MSVTIGKILREHASKDSQPDLQNGNCIGIDVYKNHGTLRCKYVLIRQDKASIIILITVPEINTTITMTYNGKICYFSYLLCEEVNSWTTDILSI